MDLQHRVPGRLRPELRVAATGGRPDLGAHGAHLAAHPVGLAADLGHCPAGGGVLGGQEILDRRLPRHRPVLPGPGDSQLPAGAGADVRRSRAFRAERGGPVLRGVPHRALEHGQGHRSAGTPVDPGGDPGGVRHRQPDPGDAGEHARRAAQALCDHRPRQGPLGVHAAGQVPAAPGAEPVHLDHCLAAAQPGVGLHHRGHRAEPAHRRPAAAAVADEPGHVSGRRLHPADLRADRARLAGQ